MVQTEELFWRNFRVYIEIGFLVLVLESYPCYVFLISFHQRVQSFRKSPQIKFHAY